jgi:hypothetical protein
MALAASKNLALKKAARVQAKPARGAVRVMATSRVNQSKSDIIVSPSILSADFAKLGDEVSRHAAGVTTVVVDQTSRKHQRTAPQSI